jgi:FAD/FMN-containing dehydrogenase
MVRDMTNWGSLASGLEGEVGLPGTPAYEGSPRPFNARFRDVLPEAIVSCATPEDVAATIVFARRSGLDLVARNGGHSFAGQSTCRGIVVDVSPMRSVAVSDGIATVGAGARLGGVYAALEEHGLAIPAGTCPAVGVAGLTLGGGLGILGRRYGVSSDRLVGAELVPADGRILACDEHHDADLFWALRGAGAAFGIVTSLVFRPIPAPEATTNAHLVWPVSRAADVIAAWQMWAPDAPDELAASLKVTAGGGEGASVDVYAAHTGDGPAAEPLLTDLVDRVGVDPSASSREVLSFPETRRFWANLGQAERAALDETIAEPVCLFAKSEFFRRPLPAEAIGGLLQTFESESASGLARELDFMPWGGAYNRVPADATAFVHREERFQLKHAVVLDPDASPGAQEAASRQVARSWASVHRWGSGRVFQNFADPDLDQWSPAYHGPNLDRLREVKARYDPENVLGSRAG